MSRFVSNPPLEYKTFNEIFFSRIVEGQRKQNDEM